MAEATNPIPTASNPRVGPGMAAIPQAAHEIIAEAADLFPQSDPDVGFTPFEDWRLRLWKALASAPSPEAGAGGDLGEQKGACLTAPGSCPSGPTASRSSGFAAAIPSRGWSFDMEAAPRDGTKVDLMYPEPRGRAINCLWYGDLGFGWIWRTPKWQLGQIDPLPESEWDIHCYPNMEPYAWRLPDEPGALAGEAEGRDRQGSVHEHAAPQEATPQSSPSQTPVDPQMTVEEARRLLSANVPAWGDPASWIEACRFKGSPELLAKADRVEAALRTLQAAGEVR